MDDLNRPEIVNVENIFNEYVEYFGGQVISKNEENFDDRPNADYLFRNQNVIAELKCFQKDLFNNEEDIPRLLNFFDKWEEQKLIEQGDKLGILLGAKRLPKVCYIDLLNACTKTVDRILHKANKQIKESKKTFSLPTAKGLVLLCNDGNYFIQNGTFVKLIADLMSRKYMDSDIDGFVYFTVNQTATMPDSDLDWNLWFPSYRQENDEEFGDFVNELGYKFNNDFITMKTGITLSDKNITDSIEKDMDKFKLMKHVPKEIIYKKK